MDETNLNSSQESLLPFSEETCSYLLSLLGTEENSQFLMALNDLPELGPDPPIVPFAHSSLPGTVDWPGDMGFKVKFGLQYEIPEKHVNWVYSEKENKLYVKKDALCPISVSTTLLMPPGRTVRAMVLYKSPEHALEVVERCPSHSASEIEKKIVEAKHLVRSASSSATYYKDTENKHLSVVVPFMNPPAGHSSSTYIYKFTCFNSCYKGRRRSLTLVFTLEENNMVIGRQSVDLKICACPGRDSGTLEKATTSSSKKWKMESSPQGAKAMLPKRPSSNVEPKNKSDGKRGEFPVETNSLECYNFLRVMRKLHHFNSNLTGFPNELGVFFNVWFSSSSEDERSQDEEQRTETMKQ